MRATPRVVSQPNTKILDFQRRFVKLLQSNIMYCKFTVSLRVKTGLKFTLFCTFDGNSHPTFKHSIQTMLHVFIRDENTSLIEIISPLLFLTFFNFAIKYQNRDLAVTLSGANIFIRYNGGFGTFAVGRCRPTTLYCFNYRGNKK